MACWKLKVENIFQILLSNKPNRNQHSKWLRLWMETICYFTTLYMSESYVMKYIYTGGEYEMNGKLKIKTVMLQQRKKTKTKYDHWWMICKGECMCAKVSYVWKEKRHECRAYFINIFDWEIHSEHLRCLL